MKILSLLPLAAVSVFAQCSITVTGPANNAVVQSTTLPLTAVLASCPAVYRVNWLINGRLYDTAFSNTSLTGSPAWSVLYYPPWPGDGIGTVQAIAYDALNNKIAASAVQKFTARTIGSGTALVGSIPTSGSGSTITISLPLGGGGQMYIDGRQDSLGFDCTNYLDYHGLVCKLDTTKHRNGLREFWFMDTGVMNGSPWTSDPVIRPFTFTSSNISGNTITATGNGLVTDHPFVLSTTGTLPTCSGCRASPLQTGAMWHWSTSGQTNTITFTVSSGVATGTCSSACGLSTGDVIDIEASRYAATLGLPVGLKGKLAVASSSGPSATTFTVSTPLAPDGTYSPFSMVMYTHAYYAISLTNDTFQIAETPGGSAVTITGGGSGTHTENETLYPPYWGSTIGFDPNNWNGPAPLAFAYQLVDIENGAAKMEMQGYDEGYLCLPGHTTATCPGTLSIAPRGINTDLSTFAITATDCAYTVVPDGGFTSVVSVNASGVITALNPGWAKVTTASNTGTCTGMATLTTYVKVYAGDADFPTFTRDGHIAANYTAGQSFIPTVMWNQGAAGYPWLGPVMNASGLNSTMQVINQLFGDPIMTGCPSEAAADTAARAFADKYGTFFEYYFGDLTWPPWNFGAVLKDYNFDRHTCLRNLIANLKADARTWRLYGYDELNIYEGGSTPNRPGIVGTSSYFDHITVTGCPGACLATATVDMSLETSAVTFINATNSFLNGLFVPTVTSADPNSGNTLTFTFPIPGASNGTYDKTNNATLELLNFYSPSNVCFLGCTHQGPLPSLAGTGSGGCQMYGGCIQHWSSALTSIVASSNVCTVNWTAHALTGTGAVGSNVIQIAGATTANLNLVALVTRIGANSFTVPCPGVANGTYNSGTDSGLGILVDALMSTNRTFDAIHDLFHAGGDIAVTWPILGTTYTTARGSAVKQWEGKPNIPGISNIADAAWNYQPVPCLQFGFAYGDDCSLRQTIVQLQESGINTRAWQTEPRATLLFSGPIFARLHQTYAGDPGMDVPFWLNARPWDMTAQIMYAISIGQSAIKMYNAGKYRPDEYDHGAGGATNGGTNGLEHDEFPIKTYNAMALSFNALQRWTKYVLEPRISFESYGPEFYGTARYSTYGGFKLIGSLSETPYQQTIRLTNINITGGTMRRECVDGYRFTIAELAGNPTSDTHNFQPGETCAYISQPAGSSDIDHIPFPPPPSLPFGASKFVVRVGYYPLGRAMDDAPATDCTLGCTIPVNHYNAPAWYQILYLGANNKVLSTLEPQTIAKSN